MHAGVQDTASAGRDDADLGVDDDSASDVENAPWATRPGSKTS